MNGGTMLGLVVVVASASACARSTTNGAPPPQRSELRSGEMEAHGHGHGGQAAEHGGSAMMHMCSVGTGTLRGDARDAVIRALAEERRAQALYAALDGKVGSAPSPFPHALNAERHHAAELERVLRAHGETVPTTDVPAPVALSGGVREACALGASSERTTIALYDELLQRSLPDDVRCVFGHLRAASVERHLPAFERCAR